MTETRAGLEAARFRWLERHFRSMRLLSRRGLGGREYFTPRAWRRR